MKDKDRKYLMSYVEEFSSASEAARAWGIHPNTLRDILKGNRGIGVDVYAKLKEAIPDIDDSRLLAIRKL